MVPLDLFVWTDHFEAFARRLPFPIREKVIAIVPSQAEVNIA